MSYVPRHYESIVRDLLTTLTGGTVRESLTAPVEGDLLKPLLLRDRPVRRVSHLEGVVQIGTGPEARDIDYRFTPADFELISLSEEAQPLDAIRFRDGGNSPKPGSTLLINYYPVQTNPVPLTDVNVGSVSRTLLETIARELALSYLHLERIYQSAFLDTAEGNSLDKVVALVGVVRVPAGYPVVKLRFTRQSGSSGRITVPVGTAATDANGNRYLTLTSLTLEPGETTRDVLASGESPGTELVEQGQLDRLETLIAGISSVTNPEPARQQSAPETDDELRRRARGSLHGVVRGTLDALRFGLLSVPGVKEVAIQEFPNGVAGEIKIDVAYTDENPDTRQEVAERIRELRPAGIRVITGEAARQQVAIEAGLILAGAGLADTELKQVQDGVEDRLAGYLQGLAPDGKARSAKLAAMALQDERISDISLTLTPDVTAADYTPAAMLDITRPFTFTPPQYEQDPGSAPASVAAVTISLPLHLVAGVSLEEAEAAIQLAIDAYLASRGPDQPLTVDSFLAAIRDDSRFAAVRSETLVTVENASGQFLQLSDGLGSYIPAPNESLQKSGVEIQVREGEL
jgi:uncharacterized phage protein gp47/JayE